MNQKQDNFNKNKEMEKSQRFKKSATCRTINVLKSLKVLGNCANRNLYEYTESEVEKIFKAVEKKTTETRAKFNLIDEEKFEL